MKKINFLFIFFLLFNQYALASDMPKDLKDFLMNKFPGISFKIDNSFVVNNEIFLPLVPQSVRAAEKIEITHVIPDKTGIPKLFWFSNNWVYVKLIKQKDGDQSILDLKEIPVEYKEQFLKSKFPGDLVVPSGFFVKQELSSLIGELPVETKIKTPQSLTQMKNLLYLTSPDSGKIIYLNLKDLSMIYNIQTEGTPWEIAYSNEKNSLFITDFSKDLIYETMLFETSILRNLELPSMSSPIDIEVSYDGSLAYVLGGLTNDFTVYKTIDSKPVLKIKLPPSPNSFAILKELRLIAITSPNANSLVFLNADDFSPIGKILLMNGPEKIVSDPLRNVFYVTHRNGNTVSVIDAKNKSIKNIIQVDETPTSLVLDPQSKYLYVCNAKSSSISVIDLESSIVTDTINLPLETQFPGDIEITSDGNWLVVTSETTDTISIIDLTVSEVAVKLDVGATTHAAFIINKN